MSDEKVSLTKPDLDPSLREFSQRSTKSRNVLGLLEEKLPQLKLNSFLAFKGLNQIESPRFRSTMMKSFSETDSNCFSSGELNEFLEVCDKIVKHSDLGCMIQNNTRGAPNKDARLLTTRVNVKLSALAIADTPAGESIREGAKSSRDFPTDVPINSRGREIDNEPNTRDAPTIEIVESAGITSHDNARYIPRDLFLASRGRPIIRKEGRQKRPKLISLKDERIDPFEIAQQFYDHSESLEACVTAGYPNDKLRDFVLRAFSSRCSKHHTLLKYTRFVWKFLEFARSRRPPAPICGEGPLQQ